MIESFLIPCCQVPRRFVANISFLIDRRRTITSYRILFVVATLFAVAGCATDTPKIVDSAPAEPVPSHAPARSVPVQPIVPEPLASEGMASSVSPSHVCDVLAIELSFVLRRGEILNYEYTVPLVHQIRTISQSAIENNCYSVARIADDAGDTAQLFQEYYAAKKVTEKGRDMGSVIEEGISDVFVTRTCYKNLKSFRNPYLFAGALLGCTLYVAYTKLFETN